MWEEVQMAKLSLGVLLSLLVLLVGLSVLPAWAFQISGETNEFFNPDSNPPCFFSNPQMDPTHEMYKDHIAVWQIPSKPKAVLFLAHGANHSALSFFDPGPRCPLCTGHPQERIVVLDALERGYAVLAMKFGGATEWSTWPRETSQDIMAATEFIKAWTKEHSLEDLPLFAWGNSIGGDFVTSLSLNIKFTAQVLMCSRGRLDAVQEAKYGLYPSTMFVHTVKDTDTTLKIYRTMKILRERGISTAELLSFPKPVYLNFFAERIRCMSEDMSEKVYNAYKAEGWMNSGGYLLKDAMFEDYRSPLRKCKALPFCKEDGDLCLLDGVGAELLVAYGFHSWTSERNGEIFTWLDSRIMPSADNQAFHLTSR